MHRRSAGARRDVLARMQHDELDVTGLGHAHGELDIAHLAFHGMAKPPLAALAGQDLLGSPRRLEGGRRRAQLIHQARVRRIVGPGGAVGAVFGDHATGALGPVDV